MHNREMVTSEQIVKTRKRLGLSQAALGRHFGVNIATIWRWENEGVPEQGTAAGAIEKWIEAHSEERAA